LAVVFGGSGAGTIDVTPSGTPCTTNCNPVFDSGAVVTLTARPSANSQFGGWSGDCAVSASSQTVATVTMDAAKRCVANFLATFSLTITKAGTGQGSVTSGEATPLIDCGAVCTADYVEGTNVTLTASPLSPAVFTGWSGDCAVGAASPTVQVSVAAVTGCIATFDINITTSQTFNPPLQSRLPFSDFVTVNFNYETSAPNGVVVTVHPLIGTLGEPAPGGIVGKSAPLSATPSGVKGIGVAEFTVNPIGNGADVIVNQVRLVMSDALSGAFIAETTVDAVFTFFQLLL
jgi:hypothetical protein